MKRNGHSILLLLFVWIYSLSGLSAQGLYGFGPPDTTGPFGADKWQWGGYLKNMQVINHLPAFEQSTFTTFFHHRLNARWSPNEHWSLGWEQRTRFFIGDDVRLNPLFGGQLEMDPGIVDASWVPWEGKAALLHSRVERLWVAYEQPNWELRIGRQRINWGVHLVWNPNDLFNAFNFLDFDYAERPGADAIRFLAYLPNGHSLEAAWEPSLDAEDWQADQVRARGHTAALRYGLPIGSYDVQMIAGWRISDFVLASGWAGNLGLSGFKGELAWFRASDPDPGVDRDAVTGTVSFDRSFDQPIYAMVGLLYTSRGATDQLTASDLGTFAMPSPTLLSPARWTGIGQVTWSVTPLLGLDASVLYGPGPNLFIVFPSLRYNIANDWDVSVTGQLFWLDDAAGLTRQADAAFIRFTWSY